LSNLQWTTRASKLCGYIRWPKTTMRQLL
jgi:hypothetical protein